jgi:TDG/mug DNA glycosylase family protein
VRVDYDASGLAAKIARFAPDAVAFVSKAAAHAHAQGAGLARPKRYGETPWPVGGSPGFVLPGPSGANNGMPLPLRIGLWRDLADFLDTL